MTKLSELIKNNPSLFNVSYIFEWMEDILPEELQNIETENLNIIEITDESITVIVGGDWEGGTEIKFLITDDFSLKVLDYKKLSNDDEE